MEENENLVINDLNEENKPKKRKYSIIFIFITIIVIFILISLILFFFIFSTKKPNVDFNFTLKKSDSKQDILVYWKSSEILDLISIRVKGLNNEDIRIYNFFNSIEGEGLVQVYYGLPKINIYYKKGNYNSEKTYEFNVSIKEIFIAPIAASLPIMLLSFELFNISNTYNCPIFVFLERYKTWNWDYLPNNVYLFDFINQTNFRNINFYDIYFSLDKWINQLYKANNDIKIHLFLNDYHLYVFALYIFANNIPEKNYDLTLLSDGTASYMSFNKYFDNNETYIENYRNMRKKWKEHKQLIWDLKSYSDNIKNEKFINSQEINYYCYIIVNEEKNVYWWLTKIKGLFAPNNPKMLDELINNKHILLKDTQHLLSLLNESEAYQIKNLFNFKENYFEEASQKNKSIMVIAGTYHQNENYFYDYCKALKKFYRQEFIYYYKGHPLTPTENYPDKQRDLKNINITTIDSIIPLEIIFYFNPEIYLSGYYTSSFIEIKNKTLKALFDQFKKDEDYFKKFDFFMKYIDKNDTKFGQYLNATDGIVLDLNREKLKYFEYDFGIYYKEDNIINYYNYE